MVIVVLALQMLLSSSSNAEEALDPSSGCPAQLTALPCHYRVSIEKRLDTCGLVAAGVFFPWDDGQPKSDEQRLSNPDVQDLFAFPYPRGPISSVGPEQGDPGRARLEPMMDATYLQGGKPDLQSVDFLGYRASLHERVAPSFLAVIKGLEDLIAREPGLRDFLVPPGGGYMNRTVRGERRKSPHAWGIAFDIATAKADYWRWAPASAPLVYRNRIPASIVEVFEAQGWIWGGRWHHHDTMHFEYRPELLGFCDESARP